MEEDRSSAMKLLIAEDDPVSALVLQRTLEKLGHEPTVVASGREGLAAFEAGSFRIVVSDWMMPEMDGIDLCQAIRGMDRDWYTYFILLTARTQRDDRLAALAAGIDDFLEKPLDKAELTARLAVADRLLRWEARLHETNELLRQRNEEVAFLANHDPLTETLNRRAWFEVATQRRPRSLAVFDIDHFKMVNDTFGHPAGDAALSEIARRVHDTVAGQGTVGRLGGEEFGILFECDASQAQELSEELVRMIAETPVTTPAGDVVPITISCGLSEWVTGRGSREDSAALSYEAADRALYRAKESGRNRVVLASPNKGRRSAA